ncbi:MAG: hypothetical protein LBP56_10990 [Odoribacteraceae bacterium]|jgi:hypothetical protein|nr:hypothetical protein [Odoribacteraceae bacterium]
MDFKDSIKQISERVEKLKGSPCKGVFIMKMPILIIFSFMLLCCSKDKEIPTPDPINPDSWLDDFMNEYNIRKQGLKLAWTTTGIDTSTVYAIGILDGKLWVGGYGKATKRQFFDWVEDVELDTVINYYKGYGEYGSFKVDAYILLYPYQNNNAYCFLLSRWNRTDNLLIMNDLYFVRDGLSKKNRGRYDGIIPWYQGILVPTLCDGDIAHICFNMQGDSLFLAKNEPNIEYSCTPIDFEEYINFVGCLNNRDVRAAFFQRVNLKTRKIIWENKTMPLKDLPDNTRFDYYAVEKSNNTWTYSVYYTLYNGTKGSSNIVLDIITGQFELK